MPALIQPETVRKVIGYNSEYLTGPLVSGEGVLKDVSYSFILTQGSKSEIAESKASEEKEVHTVKNKIKDMIFTGLSMEKYRIEAERLYSSGSSGIFSLGKCGELMRKNQANASAIRDEADKLKFEYGHIRVGAMELRECVSCLSTAKDACKRATEAIETKR